MSKQTDEIPVKNTQDVAVLLNGREMFEKRTIRLNALAAPFNNDGSDLVEGENESRDGLQALMASGGLQELLAAQMLSVHQLQQVSMAMANKTVQPVNRQFFINAGIKLANTFVQQANLLSRLQGSGGQKIIVEHVDVHNGGQAVVGSIIGATPTTGDKI